MKVLVACERSGRVRDAFLAKGHDAWSCDIEPSDNGGQHIHGDVLDYLRDGWDLMIAHPPCTRLCNSGVRWLEERNLWNDMRIAAEFFLEFKNAPIPKKAIENPVPHKYALKYIGKYQQIIQPWLFDEPFTKKTCLWLIGLPPLMATVIETKRHPECHLASPGKDRSRKRSVTYNGIAKAMADQWG